MATQASTPNRWLIAAAGMIVMICLGTAYSWSSFTQPLIASFNWSNQTTTWAFAVAIFTLGWGAVIGGRWQDSVGPRNVTIVGVILWGVGNLLAGLGTSHLGAPWLYLTYGVIGGFGNGMAYITPLAMVTKWFPDKRGLAGGIDGGHDRDAGGECAERLPEAARPVPHLRPARDLRVPG